MELDFTTLTENQIKIAEKAQGLALVDLSEKNSELVSEHLGLLFQICDLCIAYEEGDDDEDDEDTTKKPSPVIDDARY